MGLVRNFAWLSVILAGGVGVAGVPTAPKLPVVSEEQRLRLSEGLVRARDLVFQPIAAAESAASPSVAEASAKLASKVGSQRFWGSTVPQIDWGGQPVALPTERKFQGLPQLSEVSWAFQDLDLDSMPGVAGNPQLVRTVLGAHLIPGRRLSLEAGVQLPLFDDRPGMPSVEYLLHFGYRF